MISHAMVVKVVLQLLLSEVSPLIGDSDVPGGWEVHRPQFVGVPGLASTPCDE